MQYVVVKDFSDIQDDRHVYLTGDTFPREGLNVSKERVAELASKDNARGEVLIKAVGVSTKPKAEQTESKRTRKAKKNA